MSDSAAAGQQQSDSSSAVTTLEAPSEQQISAAVGELFHADAGTLRQVEPLARLLRADRFAATLEKLKERRLSSPVRNDAGYFVFLLRAEVKELRATRARALMSTAVSAEDCESRIERMKRENPEEYARRMEAHFRRLANGSSSKEDGAA